MAEETGLRLAFLENLNDRFCCVEAHYHLTVNKMLNNVAKRPRLVKLSVESNLYHE